MGSVRAKLRSLPSPSGDRSWASTCLTPSLMPRSPSFGVLAALGQVSPARRGDFDVVAFRGPEYALPRPVAFGVAHVFHLVEARDRVAHVPGVGQRLLAFFGEGELFFVQLVLFRCAHALALLRHLRTMHPRALGLPGLADIAPRGFLLALSCHDVAPRRSDQLACPAYPMRVVVFRLCPGCSGVW